ncbi:hypothetical protein E3P84_01619 [Wallemia ichthyophaga]|nr:hypothetical protein E3P84_01619 [Wallemia ichthyophaga]TIB41917.1 hypothetical protein E3P83_01568 [Wallemia ichthyophaga]
MQSQIREVWADNLDAELDILRELVDRYPYVSMDTEFPGVVARPIGNFKNSSDYHYQTLRCNVDLLKIIQLGITIADAEGNMPEYPTWQFNFKFNLNDDMYAPDSIELLTKSGINFKRLEANGVDIEEFGEKLVTSGFVLFDHVHWISFHSGYDFGYLLKVLTALPLPSNETDFFYLLRIWFPCIFDIKYVMKINRLLKGGLQDIADELQVMRIGPQHQAGSDSLVTSASFFSMRSKFFDGASERDRQLLHCMGYLYGIGIGAGASAIQTPGAPFTPMSNPIPTPYVGPQPIAPYHQNRSTVGFGER